MSRRLLQYHPRIGHTYIPGLRARVPHESGGYLVKTNSSGFRSDRDFVPERTPGLRRALLFGDSSTAGDGVSNSARYSDVLEELTPGLEVYNYGLPGTGTDQQYLAYQDYAGGVAHDVLIIGVLLGVIRRIAKEYFLWNDDQGNVVAYGKPQYALTKGSLVLRNVPVPPRPLAGLTTPLNGSASTGEGRPRVVLRGIAERVGAKHAVRQIIPKVMYPEYDRADSAEWRLMRAILSEWIVCSPAPVIVMPIPDY
ncbi:MAG: SGNH/GDSL hydrolase family protein, partial [Chloroflexi bacterium]|nr:SGNH/GDSL hydrolase family protein [Chloroflexota bacterium]